MLSGMSAAVNPLKIQLMDKYLLPGRTLDLGCGNGLYGLHANNSGREVVQVDIQDRRNPQARHLPFVETDANHLEGLEGTFDNVIAFDIVEHLDNDLGIVIDLRKLCTGRIILSVPNIDDTPLQKLFLTHVHFKDKTHRREYTAQGLTSLLERGGWRVIDLMPQVNRMLPHFAHALAKDSTPAKVLARMVSLQCRLFEKLGAFENKCVADWFCVAE